MQHVHESPLVMTIPLGLLALGAIFAGWLGSGMRRTPRGDSGPASIFVRPSTTT